MTGYCWASASVAFVTLAQLLMKWGMQQLPSLREGSIFFVLNCQYGLPLLAVAMGILLYALSMICWFYVLLHLPLNLAYPLLSISYATVYLLAVMLPVFNETFSLTKSVGVLFIIFGVQLIHRRRRLS